MKLGMTLTCSLVAAALLVATPAAAGKKPPAGITQAAAQASVTEFVNALNSLSEEKALMTVAAGDRLSLRGKEDALSLISERKLLNPKVVALKEIKEGKRVIGAQVHVALEEIDPLDATRVPKKYDWVLVKEGSKLRVSVLSLWLAKQAADAAADAADPTMKQVP